MEKRNRKAGHSYSLRDRILAQIMVIIVTLTMIPFDSLVAHAATTTNVKSIGSIQTEYEVDNGTSKDDIGLPSELSVILETVTSAEDSTNGVTNEYSEDTVEKSVSWEGDYDGDTAGTYALRAEFDDSSLYYDDMPTVYVTVREAETEPEPTAPEVNNTEDEDGDDDEDPDQGKSEQKTAEDEVVVVAEEEGVTEDDFRKAGLMDRATSGVYSDELLDFVNEDEVVVEIKDKDGHNVGVYGKPGDTIHIHYVFEEDDSSDGIQFWLADNFTDDDITLHDLTMDLPSNINWKVSEVDPVQTHFFPEGHFDPEGYYIDQSGFTSIVNNNQLKFTFDDPSFDTTDHSIGGDVYQLMRISEMPNMHFYVDIYGELTEDTDTIPIPGDGNIYIDNTASIKVNKVFSPAEVKALVDADTSLQEATVFRVKVQRATEADSANPHHDWLRDESGHIIYSEPEYVEFTYKDIKAAIDEGKDAFIIEGVKADSYTVEETAAPQIPGYYYEGGDDHRPTVNDPIEADVAPPKGGVDSATITNNYFKKVGDIVVTKEITGDLDPSKLTPNQRAGIKFTVTTDGENPETVAEFTYDDFYQSGSKTIEDLPEGTYIVTETVTTEVPGFTRDPAVYRVGTDTEPVAVAKPEVVNGGSETVTVTNNYNQEYAPLKIAKNVDKTGAPHLPWDSIKAIAFTVKDAGGNLVNFVKTASGQYHYVKEVQEGGTTKYVSTVDPTQEYTAADLITSLTFEDLAGAHTDDDTNISGEITILGLPCGVQYTVSESGMKFTGFARTTSVSVDGGSYTNVPNSDNNPSGKSTVLNDNKNHSVSFKNVYTVGGKLTVKKHFNPNNIATAEKNQVTFTLYKKVGDTPNTLTDTKIQEIKYSAFSNGAYTFSNLEFGDYYVVETNQDVPNYNDATTYFVEEYTINDQGQAVKTRTPATGTSSGTTAEAEVGNASMNNPSVIDFTNTYTREAGSLQITKTLDDTNLTAEEKAEVAQKLSFAVKRGTTSIGSFTYKQLMDAVGTGTTGTITIGSYTGTVTKVDDDTYRVKIDGLPTGTYTVTETADVAGYSRESHAKNDADIATAQDPEGTSGSTTFAENGLGKVAFRNKYTPSGNLNIIKDWGPVLSNEYITQLEQTLIYKVYEYDATKTNHLGNPVNKPGTESNEYSLRELSLGITVEANKKYIVVETNADVPGYLRTTVMYSVVDEANKTSEEKQAAREATQVTVSNATAADGVFTATTEDIVEQKKKTTFHFINSYATDLIGPGGGLWIHKSYQGVLTPELEETDPYYAIKEDIASRIALKLVRYTDNTYETEMSTDYFYLSAVLDEHTKLPAGYYTIDELETYYKGPNGEISESEAEGYTLTYSAGADDYYLNWTYDITTWTGSPSDMPTTPTGNNEAVKITVSATGWLNVSFTNVYTPYGALKVTKNFTGDLDKKQIDSLKDKITFTVTQVKDSTGTTVDKQVDVFKLKDCVGIDEGGKDFYHIVTNLDLGVYKVMETISSEVGGYTRISYVKVTEDGVFSTGTNATTVTSNPDTDPANVVRGGAAADAHAGTPDPVNVIFKNDYKQILGSLIIEKALAGSFADVDPEKLNELTFTVKKGNATVKWNDVEADGTVTHVYAADGAKSSFKYSDMATGGDGNKYFKIDQLPAGTYTVTETGSTVPGFNVTTTYNPKNGVTIANHNDEKTIVVTNNYQSFAGLKITKKFIPATAGTYSEGQNVTFTVYETVMEDGKYVIKKDGRVPVIAKTTSGQPIQVKFANMTPSAGDASKREYTAEVAPGTYIVMEDGQEFTPGGNYVLVSAKANEEDYDEENGVQASIEINGSATVDFVNEYAESGAITLIKHLNLPAGIGTTDDMRSAIKFSIYNSENEKVKWNDDPVSGKHVYSANGSKDYITYGDMPATGYTIESLPAGTYRVEETIEGEAAGPYADGNPFKGLVRTSTTYKINGGNSQDGMTANDVQVVAAGVTVDYTNTYVAADPVVADKTGPDLPSGYIKLDDNGNIDEENGIKYPYWMFQVTVEDIMANMDITDTFDVSTNNMADSFRLVETSETALIEALKDATEKEHVNEDVVLLNPDTGKLPTVTIDTSASGQAVFKITDTDPTKKTNILITYYLIAKDKDAVITLNTNDGTTAEKEWKFTNQISYYEHPGDQTPKTKTWPYRYVCTGAEKDLDSERSVIRTNDAGTAVLYQIKNGHEVEAVEVSYVVHLNPNAQQIGTAETLEAYDTLHPGLKLLKGTVKIEPDNLGITWKECDCEDTPHTMHIENIPNATAVTVKYTARFDKGGFQEFGNDIQFDTFLKETTDHAYVHDEGGGGGTLSALHFYKFDDKHLELHLDGAVFELFDDKYLDVEGNVKKLTTYTTRTQVDANGTKNGYFEVYYYDDAHTINISPNHYYHVEETTAPVGYKIPADKNARYFIITNEVPSGTVYHYNNHDYISYHSEEELYGYDEPFDTTVKLGALKELIGRDLKENEFTFTLSAVNGAPMPGNESSVEATNDANGKAIFDTITYETSDLTPVDENEDGIIEDYKDTDFTYTVTENKPNPPLPGVIYDEDPHTVVVKVGLNEDKTDIEVKSVKVDGVEVDPEDGVYFTHITNEYGAEGELVLGVKKTLKGRRLNANEFKFQLTLDDHAGTEEATLLEGMNAAPDATGYNADIVFPAINYMIDDEVDETTVVKTKVDGKDVYTVHIKPSDFSAGTAQNPSQANYEYTVKEWRPTGITHDGITYDKNEYPIKVRVLNPGTGVLTIEVRDQNDNIITQLTSCYTFVNLYNAEGSNTPEGKKILDKTELDRELQAGEFEFDVKYNGASVGKVTHDSDGNIQYPTIRAILKPLLEQGEAYGIKYVEEGGYLKEIVITVEKFEDFVSGGYTFTFSEIKPQTPIDGIVYSNQTCDVTAVISINQQKKDELIVSLSDGSDELNFTNTPYKAEIFDTPKGYKTLEGRTLKEDEFSFRITYNNETVGTVTNNINGSIKYPAIKFVLDPSRKTDGLAVTPDSETNTKLITFTSNKVEDLTGEFKFEVEEIVDPNNPVVYDTSKLGFTAEVGSEVDTTTGRTKLTLKLKDADKLNFTNKYKPGGQGEISGIKWVDTRMPEDEEFEFEIKEVGVTDPIATIKNTGTTINYPKFVYQVDPDGTAGTVYDSTANTITVTVKKVEDLPAGGKYYYTISEVNGHQRGITYDNTTINVTAEVKPNAGKLDVTITKDKPDFNFNNKYEAQGALKLEGKKTLLGRLLNSGEFTFRLVQVDENGNELKDENEDLVYEDIQLNDANGKISFKQIKYTLDDMKKDKNGHVVEPTYLYYNVKEIIPANRRPAIIYHENGINLTVKLEDDKKGNINVSVKEDPQTLFELITQLYTFQNTFVNRYSAKGEGSFQGNKELKGRKIVAGEFEFSISDSTGEPITKKITNTADGVINYPTFRYVVDSLLDPNTEPATVWDETTNTITITAAKLEDIVIADTTTNPVTYSPKKYTYTVTEVVGSEAGIGYNTGSTTSYDVTATVSIVDNDPDNGKLQVSFNPSEKVDFVNTYRAEGEDTPPTAMKRLKGRTITEGEFNFSIKDKSGHEIYIVQNDANGVITYPTFKYVVDPDAKAGAVAEQINGVNYYTITVNDVKDLPADTVEYTVTEIPGGNSGIGSGITYDGSTTDTIQVKVKVDDSDASKLDVAADRKDANVSFTNIYAAEGENSFSGFKWLTHRLPKNDEFAFVIKDKDGKTITTTPFTNTVNNINYPKFKYVVDSAKTDSIEYKDGYIVVTVNAVEKLKDPFIYNIYEVTDPSKPYITYVTDPIELKITVKPTGKELRPHVDELEVKIEKSEGNDFINDYYAEGHLKLYAKKTLLGRILNKDDFAFILKEWDGPWDAEGSKVIKEWPKKNNDADGTITFDDIKYTLDDMDHVLDPDHGNREYVIDTDKYYTVEEVVPEGADENEDGTFTYNGVTYDVNDLSKHNIVVRLHDNTEGTIEVKVSPEVEGNIFSPYRFGNDFENFYHAEGEKTISGTKTLRGRNLTEEEYQFEIKDAEGTVLATVSNDAEGNIKYPTFRYVVDHLAKETSYVFDETNNTLTLTTKNLEDMVTPVIAGDDPVTYEPKDYIYTINEVIPEDAEENEDGTFTYDGVTYNELLDEYTLTVTVAVNAEDMGILDVDIEPNEELDFINTYRAKGEDTVVGEKILKGADIKDFEGKFNFTVTDGEGNLITTVSNDAAGKILYPTFRYVVDPDLEAGAVYDEEANVYTVTVNAYEDLEEVYTFKVTELQGDIEDMAYNVGEKLEYEITVTVVADEEDHAILNVVALPNTAVDFVNRQYFKAGLYKISEDTSEALKGAVIRLVRVEDGKIIDEWTTDGTVHLINLIEIGTGTFRFIEVKTPDGYEYARNIEFKMSEDGEFSSEYDHVFDKNGNAVFIMRDPSIPNTKTGDEAPLAAAGGAFAVGLAGLAAVIASKKRRA